MHAVRSTAGEVVTYHGSLIQAFYAASDGGHSDSVEDVWHGGNPAYAIPWLTGVCDPGESTAANPWTSWTKAYTATDATARIAPYSGPIGTLRRFTHIDRAPGGRILRAVAVGSSGSAVVTGGEMKAAFGWYDQRVWVNSNRTISGPIREMYDKLGCRPGLPSSPIRTVQGGAEQYFANGGLYRNGAAGLTVWLRGSIDHEFRAVDAVRGVLGVPLGAPERIAARSGSGCASCTRVSFEGGRIYASNGTGAHALWGNVLTSYLGHGGCRRDARHAHIARAAASGRRRARVVPARQHRLPQGHLHRLGRVILGQHPGPFLGSGAFDVHANDAIHPFATVTAWFAVIFAGQVISLFHAVYASPVPSGRSA